MNIVEAKQRRDQSLGMKNGRFCWTYVTYGTGTILFNNTILEKITSFLLRIRIRHFVLLNFLTVWHHIHQILKKHNVCKKFILCSSIKSKLSEGFHKVCINFHRVWFKTFFVKWNYFIEQLVCENFWLPSLLLRNFETHVFCQSFGRLSKKENYQKSWHKYFPLTSTNTFTAKSEHQINRIKLDLFFEFVIFKKKL